MRLTSSALSALLLSLVACVPPPVCGDGEVNLDLSEECDDGNLLDGDGCSSVCALQTQVTTDDVNGANANGAFVSAIFAEAIFAGQDLDFDGQADDAQSVLNVVSADIENLCDIITADPTLDTVSDIQFASSIVIKTELNSAGTGFAGDQDLIGDGDLLAGLFVSGLFIVKQEGVEVANALGEGFGTFVFNEDKTLNGAIFDTLTTDNVTQTDINAAFEANYVNAVPCPELFQ